MIFVKLNKLERRERLQSVLRMLVLESGYTQRAIADRMGYSKSYVGHVLTGQRYVEYTEICDWLDALGISSSKFEELLNTAPKAPY